MTTIKDYNIFKIEKEDDHYTITCVIDGQSHKAVYAKKLDYLMEIMLIGDVVSKIDGLKTTKFNGWIQKLDVQGIVYADCVGVECILRNNAVLFRTNGSAFITVVCNGSDTNKIACVKTYNCGDPELSNIANVVQDLVP